METIWKYEFAWRFSVQGFPMPDGARVLSVGVQDGPSGLVPVVWAVVDPKKLPPKGLRMFLLTGTGHDDEITGTFVGTLTHERSGVVFHIFDLGVKENDER